MIATPPTYLAHKTEKHKLWNGAEMARETEDV
jgi:hypothetical protein